MQRDKGRTFARRIGGITVLWTGIGAILLIVSSLASCSKGRIAQPPEQTSASCMECHKEIHHAWHGTDHALANRLVDPDSDAAVLATFPSEAGAKTIAAILGNKPLWQPLVSTDGGRLQPHEIAYDPANHEWFNVFGEENRRAGEWGHWTGRGMNWNSMCAQCHMTGYEKGYDLVSDSYSSKWIEQGVGCVQCHGQIQPGHGSPGYKSPLRETPVTSRAMAMETCAPCHARNEVLAAGFKPGDRYDDFHRITLPVDPGVFWPDGQQREEVFNWTSILLSKMGHAGVNCMDCHDPHTTRAILPVEDNSLCMQCHSEPGRVQPSGVRAVVIDPTAHSRHAAGSTGNRCVECHMPRTNYMQRAPRHDHGFIKPDPLLTKELGIPNACNSCHADKDTEWAISHAEAWYGNKLDSRQRARARGIAAAHANEASATDKILGLLADEEIPAWRATYLQLLAPRAGGDPRIVTEGLAALEHEEPLVRASGARVLSGDSQARTKLRSLLNDSSRLVRLDAAWALSDELPAGSPARKELDEYLGLQSDQPAGRLRIGQDLANQGRLAEGLPHVEIAAKWDPFSVGILEVQAAILNAMGKPKEAAAAFFRAGQLDVAAAVPMFHAGLAYADAGMTKEAMASLEISVRRDPRFDRAWYNLGLLRSQTGDSAGAIDALATAENVAPGVADYPYAAATVLLRSGRTAEAKAAALRVLAIDPARRDAAVLLRSIP